MNPTNGDKYRNKETGQIYQAKQCFRHYPMTNETIFGDGSSAATDSIPTLAPSQWLLTSAIGEQTICPPSEFNRNFTLHFEEDDGK